MMTRAVEAPFDPRRCGAEVLRLVEGADRLTLVAPFVTLAGLEPIVHKLQKRAEITLYTRWRPDEVAAGVSEPQVLSLIDPPGAVFLHPTLHAKAYVRPGFGTLVGSSNITAVGLGWSGVGGVELLVQVGSSNTQVSQLLEVLRVTSCRATKSIADEIIAQAQVFEQDGHPAEFIRSGSPAVAWLPQYPVPRVLWQVYQGNRDETVAELVRPDLEALCPPRHLTQEQFAAYVAGMLLQGLPGCLAAELKNLTTHQAIQRLSAVADEAGLDVEDPEMSWKTLSAWLAYFLPNTYTLGPGGRMLIG